jgi:hypothetical protein
MDPDPAIFIIVHCSLASQSGHVLAFFNLAEMHATGTGNNRVTVLPTLGITFRPPVQRKNSAAEKKNPAPEKKIRPLSNFDFLIAFGHKKKMYLCLRA